MARKYDDYQATQLNESLDVSNEELTEMFDNLTKHIPDLEKLIAKRLNGMKVKLSCEMETIRGNPTFKIKSGDLKSELGKTLVNTLFKGIVIDFWGGTIADDGSIWFNPQLAYTHPGGGSNGRDFVWQSLWFKPETSEWIEGRLLTL